MEAKKVESNIEEDAFSKELHLHQEIEKTTQVISNDFYQEEDKVDKSTSISDKTIEIIKKSWDDYELPPLALLKTYKEQKDDSEELIEEVETKKEILNKFFENFNLEASVLNYKVGPRLVRFEISIGDTLKISKITNLYDNIKLSLAAKSLRILAPIPGKNVLGIEIPHSQNNIVGLRSILEPVYYANKNRDEKHLSIAIGKDNEGNSIVFDIRKTPHLLIAGATGSGKSVAINVILTSLLMQFTPAELNLLLIDPKQVEFAIYNELPHLVAPIVNNSTKAALTLKKAVEEMESRYELMALQKVRNIEELNDKLKNQNKPKLPYLVIIIDELADLMVVARKEVEESIMRITQKARAAGIHLVVATQKPSTEIITGVIKANIPSRIAFTVSSGYDSRTILDEIGAEDLIGKGDMLISMYGQQLFRGQCSLVTNDEVDKITAKIKKEYKPNYDSEFLNIDSEMEQSQASGHILNENDPMYLQGKSVVVEMKKASTSLLQRRLRIGYNKAADIIDSLEHYGVVGPQQGSKPREVLIDE